MGLSINIRYISLNKYWALNKDFNAPFENTCLNIREKKKDFGIFHSSLTLLLLLAIFYIVFSVLVRALACSPGITLFFLTYVLTSQ